MDAPSCVCVKPGPQKEENTSSLPPSVRVRVCFFVPQGASSVRYPSHNSCIFSQYSSSVPLWRPKTLQNSQSRFDDVKPYFGWRPGLSIARWAGCLCPCATQRERSPCPSEGLNWDPQGCRALAPRPRTLAAQASTPVRSRQNHLKKSQKKIKKKNHSTLWRI